MNATATSTSRRRRLSAKIFSSPIRISTRREPFVIFAAQRVIGKMTYNPSALARFVFFAVLAAWCAFAALFIFYKQPSKGKDRSRDPISVAGLALQMLGYFFVFNFARPYYSPIFPMPAPAAIAVAIVTMAIAFGSVWFCLQAIRALEKHGALVAQMMEGHELVMRGRTESYEIQFIWGCSESWSPQDWQ